jgi:predicted  nucleic acid-binding Zn-ribbon protein
MPPAQPQSTAYLLGQLIESVAGLRRDITDLRSEFNDEKDHAHESRKDMHRKVDDLTDRVGKAETTIQVAGQVTAQTRDKVDAMDATLTSDVKPTVDEFKRMKLIGWSVVGIVGLGGTAFGASLIWWGEQVVTALRGFLRIS